MGRILSNVPVWTSRNLARFCSRDNEESSRSRQLLVLVFKNGFDLRLLIVSQLEFVAEPCQLLLGSVAPSSFVPIPVLAGLR